MTKHAVCAVQTLLNTCLRDTLFQARLPTPAMFVERPSPSNNPITSTCSTTRMRNLTPAVSVVDLSRNSQLCKIMNGFTVERDHLCVKHAARASDRECRIWCTGGFTLESCHILVTIVIVSSATKWRRERTSVSHHLDQLRAMQEQWRRGAGTLIMQELLKLNKQTSQLTNRCRHFLKKFNKICSSWGGPRADVSSAAEYKISCPGVKPRTQRNILQLNIKINQAFLNP